MNHIWSRRTSDKICFVWIVEWGLEDRQGARTRSWLKQVFYPHLPPPLPQQPPPPLMTPSPWKNTTTYDPLPQKPHPLSPPTQTKTNNCPVKVLISYAGWKLGISAFACPSNMLVMFHFLCSASPTQCVGKSSLIALIPHHLSPLALFTKSKYSLWGSSDLLQLSVVCIVI